MASSENDPNSGLNETVASLLRRQEAIERRLSRIEHSLAIPPPRPEAPKPAPQPVVSAPEAPPPAPPLPVPTWEEQPVPSPPAAPSPEFETRVGLTWINRIGVVTLVLGVAFFFKYAVDNQWIGPTGRVLLGILAGMASIGTADRLWRRGHQIYAQGVAGAGIAILYLSFYASFGFYHLLPQGAAFLLMVLVTAAAGVLAVCYNSLAVAVLGLAGGYATPVLLSTGEDRPVVFFGYVLLLNIGALALARLRKWRALEWLAFAATVALYASWFESRFEDGKRYPATVFALLFYALFAPAGSPFLFSASQILAVLAMSAIWASRLAFLPLGIVLSAAGLAITDRRALPRGAAVTFGAFWLLTAAWYAGVPSTPPVGALFGLLTLAFLLFLGWIPWRLIERSLPVRGQDLVLLAVNGAAYFGLSYSLLHASYEAWLGLFAAAVGVAYVLLGHALWSYQPAGKREPRPVLLAIGVGLAFLTLAVPFQFSGYRITMAWALEAAALAWIGVRAAERRILWASLAVFVLVLVRLLAIDSFAYRDPAQYAALFNARFLTFLISALCFWACAWWIRTPWMAPAAYVSGHFIMLWGLGLEILGWVARSLPPESVSSGRRTGISFLMAAYALALVGAGAMMRSALSRVLGLGLIAMVVVKLYLNDVWQLDRIYRIVAFAVLGALLLLVSYVYSRSRTSIERWWKD